MSLKTKVRYGKYGYEAGIYLKTKVVSPITGNVIENTGG
jgi:hypothetical protein